MGVRFQRELIELTTNHPEFKQLTKEQAAQVDEAARKANDSWLDDDDGYSESSYLTEQALKLFNDLAGGYGVEGIDPQELPDHQRRSYLYDCVMYVNTGETYYATLMFDYLINEFFISDWGTYCFEVLEREAYEEGILDETDEQREEREAAREVLTRHLAEKIVRIVLPDEGDEDVFEGTKEAIYEWLKDGDLCDEDTAEGLAQDWIEYDKIGKEASV